MKLDDLGRPVTTSPVARMIVGGIFLTFSGLAAIAALGIAAQGAFDHPGFVGFFALLAIVVGYVGYRLVKVADGEQLLGRVASILAAIIMIVSGIAVGLYVLLEVQAVEQLSNGLLLAFLSVIGGMWLLRSSIHRKDEP